MKYKEVAQILLSQLNIEGFRPGTRRGHLSLMRKGNDFTEYIDFTITVLSEGIKFNRRTSAKKDLHVIENILNNQYNIIGETKPANTLGRVSRPMDQISDIIIRFPEDVSIIAPYLKEQIELDLLPLFESFPDVKSVYEHIENSDLKEIYSLLGNPGGSLRRLVIKAMVKAPDFEEFGKQVAKEAQMYIAKYNSPNYKIVLRLLPNLIVELREMYNGPVIIEEDINYSIGPYLGTNDI